MAEYFDMQITQDGKLTTRAPGHHELSLLLDEQGFRQMPDALRHKYYIKALISRRDCFAFHSILIVEACVGPTAARRGLRVGAGLGPDGPLSGASLSGHHWGNSGTIDLRGFSKHRTFVPG